VSAVPVTYCIARCAEKKIIIPDIVAMFNWEINKWGLSRRALALAIYSLCRHCKERSMNFHGEKLMYKVPL
jgi:hypothetical protein